MASVLAFADDEALRVILLSGLCPPEVHARGARVARDPRGALMLAPDAPLPTDAIAALRAAGVELGAALPPGARAVRCWAEAIAPVAAPEPRAPALALLTATDDRTLIELSAELLRLGCERQELWLGPGGGIVRAIDPPTYSVVRAAEPDGGIRCYVPDPPGQDAVWTEHGRRHPLAARLRPEPGHLLLIARDGWRAIRDAGWRPLDAALELAVAAGAVELATRAPGERRRIELRLAPGRREPPSLWVIRRGGTAAIDRLLGALPDDVVARLTFAAGGRNADTLSVPGMRLDELGDGAIVIRARAARQGPPDLSLDAEAYAPLAQLPDVYAPAGALVEPPLRRDRLRDVLGAAPGFVSWLAPLEPRAPGAPVRGAFRVERIAEAAFAPLADWADYVIHASAPALVPWQRAAVFDFAPYVSTGVEWASAPAPAATAPDRGADRAAPPAAPAPPPPVPTPAATTPRPAAGPRPPTARDRPHDLPDVDAQLAALEAAFVALDAPADAPARLALFEQLGHAYLRHGRRRDAGLCLARAVWERAPAAAAPQLDAWLAAELGPRAAELDAVLRELLPNAAPTVDQVRAVALIAARAPAAARRHAHAVVRWLDDHDAELDARTLWLARVGLATLVGGDPLGLARTRDRILARLAGGLPIERELPAFLRVAGRTGALGTASAEQLAKALDLLADKIRSTRRARSETEPPPERTAAYASLQLAHGYARIGLPARARALIAEARRVLDPLAADPVHGYLGAAFTARIEQAIAGEPAEAPLPTAIVARLATLDRLERYKVDRLREGSRILEPVERADAFGAFNTAHHDARGPELAAVRMMADRAARGVALDQLVTTAAAATDAERARLLDGVLDELLAIPEPIALPILDRATPLIAGAPAARQAVLYAEALVVAGHFGRTERAPALLERLAAALPAVPGKQLARALDHGLRALRRIGLRREVAELLAGVEAALEPGAARGSADAPHEVLQARLALAGGLAYLGDTARALPILEQGRRALDGELTPITRLELTRALALAYAQAPLGDALAAIGELSDQLRDITDSYNTNTHYCLSVLHFVESLVLGIASDDLALGEAGRRFVEDDEHLIRRRLHRDLGGTS